jgi:hypothetical protein
VESACGVLVSILNYSNNTGTHEGRCWRSGQEEDPKNKAVKVRGWRLIKGEERLRERTRSKKRDKKE